MKANMEGVVQLTEEILEGAAVVKQQPIRKFNVKVGEMDFVKRCTVVEMVAAINAAGGVSASLILDGHEFALIGPAPAK